MLSLSSKNYSIPVKEDDGSGIIKWRLFSLRGDDVTVASTFRYVIIIQYDGGEQDRLSFMYDGNSVRPDGRTLRLYGPRNNNDSYFLNFLVSKLSLNTKVWDNNADFLLMVSQTCPEDD